MSLSDIVYNIRHAVYAKKVREAIASAIEEISNKEDKNLEIYNNMVIGAGESNAEIVDARLDNNTGVKYEKVGKRLDKISSQMDEKANKNDVANLSSVTPEFASSIDKMIDTTKTYVNISDGYIYLYNSTTSKFEKSSLQYQATGLNDKSVDITKLEEKIQNKFEKETTETDIIGGELSISKYMINGVDSTSKVVEGNSLAYTTNTTYGTYG
ncbi:MAG: hypothetical protein KH333_09915, partial [Clostridium sp.]|nr:hypothetical protein [Clostridium sp.]